MTDPFDLSVLTPKEASETGDRPTLGALCRIARERSGEILKDFAVSIGVSHVTVLAWERRSEPRLVIEWQVRGFQFPPDAPHTEIVLLGRNRTFDAAGPIVDQGVVADWNGMRCVRVSYREDLDEHEYHVDENTGLYTFSQRLHGRRSVLVSFDRK